jgi:hypothetical protein
MTLRTPIDGVWRLQPDGTLAELQAPSHQQATAQVELMAALVASEVPAGSEVVVECGDLVLEFRQDPAGWLALLRPHGVHPLVVKTALQRVESRSGRVSVAQPAPPLASQRRVPSMRTLRLDDGDTNPGPVFAPSESRASVSHGFVPTALRGSPQITDSIAGEVEFELDGFDETDAASMPSAQLRACRWAQVAGYLQDSIERTATYIGRTVAANYWRELLRQHEALASSLIISVRGVVDALTPDRWVEPAALQALDLAHGAWLGRCARVIPDIRIAVLRPLGLQPWRNPSEPGETSV